MPKHVKLLFVCHGNICRSPMAEFVMKELLRREGMDWVDVESAALHTDEIGNDTHYGTRRKLRSEGIPFSPRRAWLLTRDRAGDYDMIIGMDAENMRDLRRLLPDDRDGKIRSLLSFAGRDGEAIADPWYTGNFDETYSDVMAGCTGLVAFLCASQRL